MARYKDSNADFYGAYQVAATSWTPAAATAAHRPRRRRRPRHRANKIKFKKMPSGLRKRRPFFYSEKVARASRLPHRASRQMLLLFGRSFAGFRNDFFEVNFQDRRDAEQGVQRGILDFLLDVADGLPRHARFLGQHIQGKAALFAFLF
jgi:hypothetical protein